MLDASAGNSTGYGFLIQPMRKPDAYPEIVDAPDQRNFTFKVPVRDRARHRAHAGGEQCQSAFKFDPVSASNFDPFKRRVLTVALVSLELAGIAETRRARM